MNKKRIIGLFVLMAVCALVAFAGGTKDQGKAQFTIKLAYTQGDKPAEESGEIMYAEVFKKTVEEGTGGAVKVDLYPSGQLGTAAEQIQATVAGNLEMSIVNISMLNTLYKNSMVLSTPAIFSSEAECDAILSGAWGQKFFKDMETATGIKMLSAFSNGFRCFTTSNKKLTTVDTARGVKWRVMDSPVSIKMVEALGAIAVPMAGSEMYAAMQNKVVDGQENPVVNILNDKTYEVQKYLVLDNHMASIVCFIMNAKFFNGLPADYQKVVLDAAKKAEAEGIRVVTNINKNGLEQLKAYGMEVYIPTAQELAAWQGKIAGPSLEYVKTQLGDTVVNELVSAVNTYRKK